MANTPCSETKKRGHDREHTNSFVLVLAAFALILASGVSGSAQTSPLLRPWTLWIGPMPFTPDQSLRPDFHVFYDPGDGNPPSWRQIRTQTNVVKLFLGILEYNKPLDIPKMVAATTGKQVAFEVGGLRQHPKAWIDHTIDPNDPTPYPCDSSLGLNTWKVEGPQLQRWIAAGGKIDYLIADHALLYNYLRNGSCPDPAHPDQNNPNMPLEDVLKALVDYFVQARTALALCCSGVQFGVIEGLGMWQITTPYAPSGVYDPSALCDPSAAVRDPSATPCEPSTLRERIELSTFLSKLQTAALQANIRIDHFQVDYGYEGVKSDGKAVPPAANPPFLDYGRILATEAAVKAQGMSVGIIANASEKDLPSDPPPVGDRNALARDRTIEFLKGYFKTPGIAPDSIIFQQWAPYPDTMGTENDATYRTSLGLIYASIFNWGTPETLPEGEYLVPGRIIKVTGATYCVWGDWDTYFNAHGKNGDLSGMTGYGSAPRNMTNTGPCVAPLPQPTWVLYNPPQFTAPGCFTITFGGGVDRIDFQWQHNNGQDTGTEYGWTNGRQLCVGTDNPYLYGNYSILAARNSLGGDWANGPAIQATLRIDPPAPPPPAPPPPTPDPTLHPDPTPPNPPPAPTPAPAPDPPAPDPAPAPDPPAPDPPPMDPPPDPPAPDPPPPPDDPGWTSYVRFTPGAMAPPQIRTAKPPMVRKGRK